jgi:hypothetical protein
MSGHDDGNGFRRGEDILEHGRDRPAVSRWSSVRRRLPVPRWPSRAAAALLVAAGLVAGLVAGYAAGDHRAAGGPAPGLTPYLPSQAAQLAVGGAPLGQGPACSAQVGSDLELGFQVTNVSASPVTLRRVLAVPPIGGLRALAQSWGPCGELPAPEATITVTLAPGASTWFTVTFKPLIRCPQPIPVQFTVDYVQRGRPAAAHLPGFEDLSRVPYSGCP